MDGRKFADISHYNPHHEGARRSPMCIHGVVGKSIVNFPHHECIEFIANRMKKIAGLCQHHEHGMLNFECPQPFTIHIHEGSGIFERIRY
jgi:hypothetical protein